jgi:hypothetical protein
MLISLMVIGIGDWIEGARFELSDADRDPSIILGGNGTVESRNPQGWAGARANLAVSESMKLSITSSFTSSEMRLSCIQQSAAMFDVPGGKYYYEVTIENDGLCRVGWSTASARLDLGTDNQVEFSTTELSIC